MGRAEKFGADRDAVVNKMGRKNALMDDNTDALKLRQALDPSFTTKREKPSASDQSTDIPSKKLIAEAWASALRQRNQAFPAGIFADPAWDMLLDLYVAHCNHRDVSVTSACIASNVPPTTALRWITVLLDKGLISRVSDLRDSRRKLLNLTEDGLARIEAALEGAARSDRRLGLERLTVRH